MDSAAYKLRFLIVGLLVGINVLLVYVLLTPPAAKNTPPSDSARPVVTSDIILASGLDSSNAVTSGFAAAADELGAVTQNLGRNLDSAGTRISGGLSGAVRAVGAIAIASGRLIHNSARFTAQTMYSGVTFTGRTIASGVVFAGHTAGKSFAAVFRGAGNIVGFVSRTPVVSAVISPSASAAVPVIDPHSSGAYASYAAAPAIQASAPAQPAQQTTHPQEHAPSWPIRGEITTLFGVPHWPWQPVHTGIDISDGWVSGVTPVKPYKPGKVIATVYSYSGLGNHVIVDHGSGLTSVYAHLHSISVSEGQTVDKNTSLGTEGSTGASTGTHLHFEIRINGQPVNPLDYISGRPE